MLLRVNSCISPSVWQQGGCANREQGEAYLIKCVTQYSKFIDIVPFRSLGCN